MVVAAAIGLVMATAASGALLAVNLRPMIEGYLDAKRQRRERERPF